MYSVPLFRRTAFAAALAIASLGSTVAGATLLPPPSFYAFVPGTEIFESGVLDLHTATDTSEAHIQVLTTASPLALIEGEVTNTYCCGFFGYASVAGIQGHANITYFFGLFQNLATPVPVASIPVIVHTVGEASASVPVVDLIPAGAVDLRAIVSVDNGVATQSAQAIVSARSGTEQKGFDERFFLDMAPNSTGRVSMDVTAVANMWSPGGVDFSVAVDPVFEIDPAFIYKDYFSLESSPGILNEPGIASAPEPRTWLLLCSSLPWIAWTLRRRHRRDLKVG